MLAPHTRVHTQLGHVTLAHLAGNHGSPEEESFNLAAVTFHQVTTFAVMSGIEGGGLW